MERSFYHGIVCGYKGTWSIVCKSDHAYIENSAPSMWSSCLPFFFDIVYISWDISGDTILIRNTIRSQNHSYVVILVTALPCMNMTRKLRVLRRDAQVQLILNELDYTSMNFVHDTGVIFQSGIEQRWIRATRYASVSVSFPFDLVYT